MYECVLMKLYRSDENVIVAKQGTIFLGGPPLVRDMMYHREKHGLTGV